jgi:flagellin
MSVINTNISSMQAQSAVRTSGLNLSTAMERLSSGVRINSAKDDAAGLAISTRMDTQIRGLSVAIRNANDGISLAQTSEGAMSEITSMLQRVRELALQSSSGVNNPSDRSAMNDEAKQLSAEINRISKTTTFNNQKILDGSFQGKAIQIGDKSGETLMVSISDMSATSLGRSSISTGEVATTSAVAAGKAAVATVAQMTFTGDDTYTFKVDGITVQATTTSNSAANIVDAINNNMKAAGKTNYTASLSGSMTVQLTNKLGGNVGVTEFASTSNGKASFNVISGGGTNVLLDDTAAITSSGIAAGSPSSSKGVLLTLATPNTGKTKQFDLNGVRVTITDADNSDALKKTKLEAALGSDYEVYKLGDTLSQAATASGVTLPAAGSFAIYAKNSAGNINVTNFTGDGTAAGVKGQISVVGGTNSAILVDSSNVFNVADAGANQKTTLSLDFTSTSSDYTFEIDGQSVTLLAADTTNGGAATKIIAAIGGTAGGLNSLDPGTIDYEVVQNGSNVTISKAGGNAGVMTGSAAVADDNKLYITNLTATASQAIAATASTFKINDSTITNTSDLSTVGYGLHTAGTVTPTKMTLQVSGDGTYAFNMTNLAGTGQDQSINASVTNGNISSLISAINNKTSTSGITAAADPNNSLALVLTRADGKSIQLTGFNASGSATMLATPNANQGVSKLLDDNSGVASASATAAGAAVASVAKLGFSAVDKYQFKISDGNSVAVVRATSISAINSSAGTLDLFNEVTSALANVASDITVAQDGAGNLTFTNAKGGKIELNSFTSDGTSVATFTPSTGQGNAKILDDNNGSAATGKSVGEISLLTEGGSTEALGILDKAMQQVSDERSKLGAIQSRLEYTVNNLSSIVTNTAASRSRILDTDYAKETTNLAKAQIIQQAATAMLAQANQSAQSVLALLK